MPKRHSSILLTGFGPFPGVPVNISSALVARLAEAAQANYPKSAIVGATLPTEWSRGLAALELLIVRHQPDICLHFGVSHTASCLQIERQARALVNLKPDNAGAIADQDLLDCDNGVPRAATLPLQAIVSRLNALSVPLSLSDDAGSYLCNATLFSSLSLCEKLDNKSICGFFHIPLVWAEDDSRGETTLGFAQCLEAGLAILDVCLTARSGHHDEVV